MPMSFDTLLRRTAIQAHGPGLLASRSFWIGGLVSALVWAAAAAVAICWLS